MCKAGGLGSQLENARRPGSNNDQGRNRYCTGPRTSGSSHSALSSHTILLIEMSIAQRCALCSSFWVREGSRLLSTAHSECRGRGCDLCLTPPASHDLTPSSASDQCALHSSVQVKSTTLGFAFSIQRHLSPSRPPSSQHSHSVVVCLAPMTNYRHSHRHAHASLPPAFQQAQSPLPTPPSSAQAFGHTYPANSSQPTGPSPSAIPQPGASIMTTGPRTPEP